MSRHFFIAGAQRSATTWLYRMLEQHPDITMATPMRPEPKYFLQKDVELNAYRHTFFPGADTLWLGEKSTSYIEHPGVAERIARLLPDAVIIFMLRDPVERAISNYRFSVVNGLESLPIAQAIQKEVERFTIPAAAGAGPSVSPFSYVARGKYSKYLDQWRQHFPANRMHLLVTEHTVGCAKAMRQLFLALGVHPDIPLRNLSESVNEARVDNMDVPAAVRAALSDVFRKPNLDLATRYGVDTGDWQ